MDCKRGKRQLRPPALPSLLGGGLLERARSTTLGLLGVTAAVGLAIVAVALNQSWPLVAGGPIPVVGSGEAAVEDAQVVARARHAGPRSPGAARERDSRRRGGISDPRPGGSGGGTPADPGREAAGRLVVSPSSPVEPSRDGGESDGGGDRAPSPGETKPQPAPKPPAPAPSQPSPAPASPPPPPSPAAESPPPPATASDVPEPESGVPPWSSGNGHAYGRSKSGWDEDDGDEDWSGGHEDDEWDRDWHDHDDDWHDRDREWDD